MSRRGNCWDNAVAESFFATLKVELAHEANWATRGQARGEVFEYIEQFYNGQRRHSALGYLSPLTFERRWAARAHDRGGRLSGRRRGVLREIEGRRGSRIDAEEGGRYLGIPPGALRDPHQQHPWYPRGGSADTGRTPERVSPHPLTAVSTEPGQDHVGETRPERG